jgi:PAS domain S-box-containing protein
MLARGRSVGVITLAAGAESGRRYDGDDLSFAEELASRAALAVDNARLYRAAQEADERYGMLFESNPQPMWVFDVDTLAFLEVNQAAVRHYGYSRDEFLSMSIMELLPREDAPGVIHGIERSGSHRGDVALIQHQRKDGAIVDMELVSREMDLDGRRARLVLATDISERTRTRAALQQSEEQLRQAQRMEAAGRLASGVAHDFNNILTTIRGFSELLLQELPDDYARRQEVEQIRKSADQGALLTRQLLNFGRQPSQQPRLLELNAVVRNMEGLIQRLVGADIRLVTHLRPALGDVKMDPGQLEQVLVNLVLNARDAMPTGGTLTIETGERQISESSRGRSVKPGRYLVLAVSDTGGGPQSEVFSNVFEPFFSSKADRSGLGLSIVYSIVKLHGGGVRVSSEPEGVRELLWKVLTGYGHTVLEARHGKDALAVAAAYGKPIDLMVSDVVMPEMSASEMVERLLAA